MSTKVFTQFFAIFYCTQSERQIIKNHSTAACPSAQHYSPATGLHDLHVVVRVDAQVAVFEGGQVDVAVGIPQSEAWLVKKGQVIESARSSQVREVGPLRWPQKVSLIFRPARCRGDLL